MPRFPLAVSHVACVGIALGLLATAAGAGTKAASPYVIDGIELGEYQKYPLLNQRLSGFRHLYGQPPEVRKAFVDAFGLER